MADLVTIRQRRGAVERHALAGVEREIRATDPKLCRKYLRDFNEAYTSYEAVLSPAEYQQAVAEADILLVGDYHALPASQACAARLVREVAAFRPVNLGVEMIFARDQRILDAWLRREIGEAELRDRLRFDTDWGYDWQPFYELLLAARDSGAHVFGLDCWPRFDMRRIGLRDRHAADKIAEIRGRHPEASLLVLFGESHLAPNHLPLLVAARRPADRALTVLQNVDALYWKASGATRRIEAVRVNRDVLCVFTATPLEKYESYRRCIERWRGEGGPGSDFAATFHNLIQAFSQFLNLNRYSSRAQFLPDLVPEICAPGENGAMHEDLAHRGASSAEMRAIVERIALQGAAYAPRLNAIFVRDFQMAAASEEVARFVHHACRGTLLRNESAADPAFTADDLFYTTAVEHALAYFGSRILYPARLPVREADLYALYAQAREEVEDALPFGYREFMQMLDFLVLHKDYEANHRQWRYLPQLLREGVSSDGEKFAWLTARLGSMLGCELYDAYIAGRVTKRLVRSLYFRRLDRPGAARAVYFDLVRRLRQPRRRLLA